MNSSWSTAALGVGALVLAFLLTGMLRRYALATRLLDHPNERSSHTVPTPRGGGVAFVVAFLVAISGLHAFGTLGSRLYASLALPGVLVAVLGFVDDRRPLPARVRFAGHLLASTLVLAFLSPLPPVPVLGMELPMAWPGLILAGAYLVWSINLHNFMDGIDGLASVQVISVCTAGAAIWWQYGQDSAGPEAALVMAACVAGFLVWNFPPARIFMGDAGSGFLGLVVGSLSLACGAQTPHLFWSWFILSGCFMVDATTTLLRRVIRGERFHEAHRTHAYQFASRIHGSHRLVTLTVAAINVVWLLPWAVLVARRTIDGVAATLMAFAPLLWLAYRYRAGDRAGQLESASAPDRRGASNP